MFSQHDGSFLLTGGDEELRLLFRDFNIVDNLGIVFHWKKKSLGGGGSRVKVEKAQKMASTTVNTLHFIASVRRLYMTEWF